MLEGEGGKCMLNLLNYAIDIIFTFSMMYLTNLQFNYVFLCCAFIKLPMKLSST